jgi:hypothetical protein
MSCSSISIFTSALFAVPSSPPPKFPNNRRF